MPGTALSAHEREEIRVGLEANDAFAVIARRLGRPTSTISREVATNGGRHRYRAARAQNRATEKRCRAKSTKVDRNRALCSHIESRLMALDSPMTIAKELAAMGGVGGDTVSAETIYQGIYAHGHRGLAAGLHTCLHRRRRCRRHRHRGSGPAPKRASPLGEFSLTKRPPAVEDRCEPGHWEGDLIIGARGRSAIVTLVERTSRYNLLGELAEGHDAESTLACLIELYDRVPAELRRSLTWDQGTEMARHPELAGLFGIDVYFAEPHHPWQRGSNENFNGLVRRYVGKGTNLNVYSQQDLDAISKRINTMPRRLHQWESACDRYNAAVVALTT